MNGDIKGVAGLIRALGGIHRKSTAANQRALTRASLIVQSDAKDNAPRSPTQAQRNKVRKTKRNTANRKKARATSRAKPGGLERSIEFEVRTDHARVFVAANSEAGSYAKKIHDEKGVSWHKRGIGTIGKGPKADSKFIERALTDNETNIENIFKSEHGKTKL